MVSGRAADPNRADEATASFVLAERLHLEVGEHRSACSSSGRRASRRDRGSSS